MDAHRYVGTFVYLLVYIWECDGDGNTTIVYF